MNIDVVHLLYGILFVGTLLLVEGLYYLVRDLRQGPQWIVNRRLRMIASSADSRVVLSRLRRDRHDFISKALSGIFPRVELLMTQAGLTMSVLRLVIIMLVLGCLTVVCVRSFTPTPFWACLGLGGVIGAGVPLLFLLHKRSRRLKRFGEQLPEALDFIVRSLRAGHPVPAAFSLVAKELHDPAGTEFGIAVDEMTYGLDLHEALKNMTARMPHDDLRFLVVAMQIQYLVGGNLTEILANLSTVIRDRFQMFGKIRALAAEGRFSAYVVGFLPIVVTGAISALNPDFFGSVKSDPLFVPLILLAVGLLVVGQFVIWRMVNFRV
jgi:tight adherence protein B